MVLKFLRVPEESCYAYAVNPAPSTLSSFQAAWQDNYS